MASENGTLAKLAEIRKKFLTGFEEAAQRFHSEIQKLRENYLNELVDVALTDPRLSDVQRALTLIPRGPSRLATSQVLEEQGLSPSPQSSVEGAIALPEKWPQKKLKVSRCPACSTPVQDLNARFCSQCASPLFEFW